MTCVENVGVAGTIAGDMQPRKPLRKVSLKRQKMLQEENGKFFFSHNSTIRRKPWSVTNAEKKQESRNPQTSTDLSSVTPWTYPTTGKPVRTHLSENSGKQRKPIRKQSKKQQERLKNLASTRLKWWTDTRSSDEPLMCGICDEEIIYFEDLASDHIRPGHGKSDCETNLQPAHFR